MRNRETMRDEQGFRTFAAERAGELRRQALLLTGSPADAVTLTEGALADTARRWHGLAPGAAEEHARRALATGAVRRNARRRGLLALLPAASRTRPPAPAGSGTPAAAGRTPAGGSDAAGARRGTGRPAGGGTAVAETGPTGAASDVAAAWRALGALPARRRAALVLRYDEGLDDAAIGARLGLSPAGAAAEQEAGLAALRSLLRLRGAP
ncbi:MAG TPA: sigma factor-like helix-turn-helix DNA-binding protein, partial [Mycobacteriales bacterium]